MKATEQLRVQAFPLASAPDLLDHYGVADGFYLERDGEGIVTIGVAARIDVEPGERHVERAARAAERLLASIAYEPGGEPVVVGALGFDGRTPGSLIVPQAAIVVGAAGARLLITGRAGMPEPANEARFVPDEPAALRAVRPVPEPERYVEAVARAVEQIRAGALRKVVLARTLEVETDHEVHVPALLERLRRVERGTFVFATPNLVGATPELLVRRDGREVLSVPLAGTAARGPDDAAVAAALLASAKDRAEHAIVADTVRDALQPSCEQVHAAPEPGVVATSKVLHLATQVRGTLREPGASALSLAAALHPTPAVCGTPRATALQQIRALEPFDRGLYAGLVGWMDARGDGCWAVSLRCAQVEGARARLYAGAGIVEGSDPQSELAETEAKFRSMLEALGYA